MNAVRKVFIIHGYLAGPEYHWFGWLKQQAENMGAEVHAVQMPTPAAPKEPEWRLTLENNIANVDENSFFVGHSLGCVTALRFIQNLSDSVKVGGIVMVSGFSQPVSSLPELDAFTTMPLDFEQLKIRIQQRASILSLNDEIVAPIHSLQLSQKLNAPLFGIPQAGHFLSSDGFTQLDIAWEILAKMMG